MARTRVKLNIAGFRQLRTSPWAEKQVQEQAERVAAAAGSGYAVAAAQPGRNRAHRIVYPASAKARSDNSRNNTLVKALNQ